MVAMNQLTLVIQAMVAKIISWLPYPSNGWPAESADSCIQDIRWPELFVSLQRKCLAIILEDVFQHSHYGFLVYSTVYCILICLQYIDLFSSLIRTTTAIFTYQLFWRIHAEKCDLQNYILNHTCIDTQETGTRQNKPTFRNDVFEDFEMMYLRILKWCIWGFWNGVLC